MRTTKYISFGAISLCARVGETPPLPVIVQMLMATSDYKDDGTNILLDANENAYGPGLELNSQGQLSGSKVNGTTDAASSIDIDLLGLNRYPDP